MKEVKFGQWNCVIKKTKYVDNDNLALVLLDKEDSSLIAYVTVNTGAKFPSDIAAVKNYSENQGMLEAITEAGLVEEVITEIPVGYVSVPVVKFNLDDVDEM